MDRAIEILMAMWYAANEVFMLCTLDIISYFMAQKQSVLCTIYMYMHLFGVMNNI